MKKKTLHYGWVIVACCGCIATASIGIIYGVSANFLAPVTTELGCSTSAFLLYVTVMSLVSLVLFPTASRLLRTMNLRILLTVSSLFMSGGFALMATYHTVFLFYFSGFLIGVGGSVLMFMTIPYLINIWFKTRVGFAMGVSMAFTGAGSAIFSPICASVIVSAGWRSAYLVMAVIAAVLLLIPSLFFIKRPEEKGVEPYGAEDTADAVAAQTADVSVTLREALRTPTMWLVIVMTMLFSLMALLQQFHVSYATKELGASALYGSTIVSVVGFVAIAAKIMLGIGNDKIGPLKTCWISGLLQIGGLALFGVAVKMPGVVMWAAALYGCGYGLYNVEPPFITRTVFGTKHYSEIWSYVMMSGSIASAVGSPLLGALYDLTGTFSTLYLVILAGDIIALVCCTLAMSTRKRAQLT